MAEIVKPFFYVKGDRVYQRPTRKAMGFSICTVHDGVDPDEVCAILNKGEPAAPNEKKKGKPAAE